MGKCKQDLTLYLGTDFILFKSTNQNVGMSMSEQKHSSCCSSSNNVELNSKPSQVVDVDPVCGMNVSPDTLHYADHHGIRYLFCCDGCKQRFLQSPEVLIKNLNDDSASKPCCGSPKSLENVAVDQEITFIDPVCGMHVSDPSKPHTVYQDQTYYFCCQGCLNKFQNQPEQYLQGSEQQSSSMNSQVTVASCCSSEKKMLVEPKTTSCCGGQHTLREATSERFIDPVCGMSVDATTDLKTDYQNQTYYFCNPSCLSRFKQDPTAYLIPFDQRKPPEGMDDVLFTCPMDPEIVQKGPGTCPICGMALEPMQPSLDDGPNPELVDFSHRFWMTLPLTLLVFVLAMGSHIHAFIPQHIQPWIELCLSLPVVLWAGKPFIERCWVSYKTLKLNMWSLIGVGILAAFVYSVVATVFPSLIPMQAKTGHGVAVYFEAACMIVSLSLLGQIMELKARAKTADALKSLLKLQPTTAKRIKHGQVVEVEIAEIHLDDILQIASGERIPLDGIVVEGSSHVDEAMMTGEPLPVRKQQDDQVIGGTINQQGSLKIRTTAVGQNTTLAKMIQTVADAQRSKAPLQRLADVVAQYFVTIVLAIALITFIAWMVLGHAQFDLALMCSVSVLIIACPCALGLATPMSVMATTGRAAQKGVLFKDAESIEALSQVNTVIIDKTGTLTEGKPSLKQIQLFSTALHGQALHQKQIEAWIASIEQHSSHPIARTLAQLVPTEQLMPVSDFEDVSGLGVQAKVQGQQIYIGSQKLMTQLGLSLNVEMLNQVDQQRTQGNVVSFVATQTQILAMIVIHDAIKAHVKSVIQQLQADGIQVVMATGDHEKNAHLVAQALGINEVYANCNPTDKLDIVKKFQQQGQIVAMAGDGMNDAPALAQANVGIAMGNGTDIAKQTAHISLVKGDIRGIADALHLAKAGVKNMKQNLAFSFVYNGLGVPVAAGVFFPLTGLLLTPMLAAVAMSLSSLSVVLNALRLNRS